MSTGPTSLSRMLIAYAKSDDKKRNLIDEIASTVEVANESLAKVGGTKVRLSLHDSREGQTSIKISVNDEPERLIVAFNQQTNHDPYSGRRLFSANTSTKVIGDSITLDATRIRVMAQISSAVPEAAIHELKDTFTRSLEGRGEVVITEEMENSAKCDGEGEELSPEELESVEAFSAAYEEKPLEGFPDNMGLIYT